jgi:hypothetical protein
MKKAPRQSRGLRENAAVAAAFTYAVGRSISSGSVLASVFGDQRLRSVRAPDLEAHAGPDVEPANRVLTLDRIVEPHLNGHGAEVVADQTTKEGWGEGLFMETTPCKVEDSTERGGI